jgi:hypothetical protein
MSTQVKNIRIKNSDFTLTKFRPSSDLQTAYAIKSYLMINFNYKFIFENKNNKVEKEQIPVIKLNPQYQTVST